MMRLQKMSNIDLTQLVTAEDKALSAKEAFSISVKAQTQEMIFSVVDQNTQASLLAAFVSGSLSTKEKATFKSGQEWIEAVKGAGRESINSGLDPDWPTVPEGVVELSAKY
jgi:hypothetical protein